MSEELDQVDKMLLAGVKPFSGRATEDVDQFIEEIEEVFNLIGVTELRKIKYLRAFLKETARDYVRNRIKETISFTELKSLLQERFRHPNREFLLRKKINCLKQTGSVSDYIDAFMSLTSKVEMLEIDRINRFILGLKLSIQEAVLRHKVISIDDAIAIAMRWSDDQTPQETTLPESNVPRRGNDFRRRNWDTPNQTRSGGRKPIQCFRCNRLGHIARECRINLMDQECPNDQINEAQFYAGESSSQLLIINGQLRGNSQRWLIDCGASNCFVTQKCVLAANIPTFPCQPLKVRFANGAAQEISESIKITFTSGKSQISIDFYVFNEGEQSRDFDLILGLPWLKAINPQIDWKTLTLRFNNKTLRGSVGKPFRIHCIEENTALFNVSLINEDMIAVSLDETEEKELHPFVKELEKDFPKIFNELPAGAPRRGPYHKIELEQPEPIAVPPRRMSPKELNELSNTLDELLRNDLIKPSMSPWSAPVLFVRKKDGTLRMCVDYRALNNVTKKAKYPIPIIDELLDQISGEKIFSSIDLRSGYYQIAMEEGSKEKTAFGTRFGQFEFQVMPFGLCNAPATFMAAMNELFRSKSFVFVYMDDILIASKTEEEHRTHLREVFHILTENEYYVKLSKCQFFKEEIDFLGHSISKEGISPIKHRLDCIINWPLPKNITEIKRFLGFIGFYRKFIADFAKLAGPLHDACNSDKFEWGDDNEKSFNELKAAFVSAKVLIHPDMTKPFILETDASMSAIGAVLKQKDDCDAERPVAFYSSKLGKSQKKYPIYELELMAMVSSLRKFRCYLEGNQFTVRTDHQALLHFKEKRILPSRVTRWIMEIQSFFPFQIEYRKGTTNVVADCLSRIPAEVAFNNGEYFNTVTISQTVEFIKDPKERDKIVREIHIESGHLGVAEVFARLKRSFYWPEMRETVKAVGENCQVCNMFRPLKDKTRIYPLEPVDLFKRWGIDVMGPFMESANGNKYVILAVEHLSRWVIAKPIRSPDEKSTINFIKEELIQTYGPPEVLITDQGTNFMSHSFKQCLKSFKIEHRCTSPNHPQTNGSTERANGLFLQILKKKLVGNPNRFWDRLVPEVLGNMRTRIHCTTRFSPYQVLFGVMPRLVDVERTDSHPDNTISVEECRKQALSNWEAQQQKIEGKNDKEEPETLSVGDTVRIKKIPQNKLEPLWSHRKYKIIETRDPIYKIEMSEGKFSWYNRSNLLLCPI